MTSNVGARLITEKQNSLGFTSNDNNENADIKELVMSELKNMFRPEFLNRVDDIIVFNKLFETDIKEIAEKMLENLKARLKTMDITLDFTDKALTELASVGFDEVYGARPLRRAITSKIEDPLSEQILEGKIQKNSHVTCDYSDSQFTFE